MEIILSIITALLFLWLIAEKPNFRRLFIKTFLVLMGIFAISGGGFYLYNEAIEYKKNNWIKPSEVAISNLAFHWKSPFIPYWRKSGKPLKLFMLSNEELAKIAGVKLVPVDFDPFAENQANLKTKEEVKDLKLWEMQWGNQQPKISTELSPGNIRDTLKKRPTLEEIFVEENVTPERVMGNIENNSDYTISSVSLQIDIYDCDIKERLTRENISKKCDAVGQYIVPISMDIPSGHTRRFNESLIFSNSPYINNTLLWDANIVTIKAKL